MIKRGVGIVHYNRVQYLQEIIRAVKATVPADTRIVVADDGSTENVEPVCRDEKVVLIKGVNTGVAANKNRALWGLQDCHYLCLLEDDLIPRKKGWFELYEKATQLSGIHHFCRVQEKLISEVVTSFTAYMQQNGITPIYASSPRGDLTFITQTVIKTVGAFNPKFKGAGYAHGEWSGRVANAGLIEHPLKWIDIVEARDRLDQIGDKEGGRWNIKKMKIKRQLQNNAKILKELQLTPYVYCPLMLE
jgi:glycosyltransferase involved in cell wall biosynthesis